MEEYNHKKIEATWQKYWDKKGIYQSKEDSKKPKSFVLDMFPYPSGEGLHVGHPKGYIATDIYSRFKKMNGHSVLHPMGWDAFGLPAENYAIKTQTHPSDAVEKNIKRYKEQLSGIGFNYDWKREINTTDPAYYKWTQWIFLQMYKKGLAFQSNDPINWCPSCQTGLANEDLDDGKCERCGSVVEKRPIRQWVLKITDYADRLLTDLDGLNWPESIKESQRNWIGKSEGAEINFEIKKGGEVRVFTTRPDTIFGATYLVLSPEHHIISNLKSKTLNQDEVEHYVEIAKNKTEIERTTVGKEKTGVELKGLTAINPATKEEIPIWIADYVLGSYGTGAIMAVPAHDERDLEFAKKFNLPTKEVDFSGKDSETAKKTITESVGGKMVTKYKLRDWVFSRQRYWGEPIPLIHCEKCGVVAVPEKDLPVKPPDVKNYAPTGTGESPLATIETWVNVKCPQCKGQAKRETNTMPQWAGSCWYYLRYMDPHNKKELVDPKKEKYWAPVDVYVGGAEHATRHLIYARFWHKFLFDIGVVSTTEPFTQLYNVGLILAEDGRKMSKRYGNVINPDEVVARYGADTFRMYEMFMGPFTQASSWDTKSIMGSRRFVERVWRLREKVTSNTATSSTNKNFQTLLHSTIKKVTSDIETFSFNTAISSLMILSREFEEMNEINKAEYEIFLQLTAPFAPHVTEELWTNLGNKKSIHLSKWPVFDDTKIITNTTKIVVQINGKVRDEFEISLDTTDEHVKEMALSREIVKKWLNGGFPSKVIYIKNKIVSIVTEQK